MDQDFRLWPRQASELAPRVDAIYIALLLMALVMTVLIFFFVIYFSIKYRRGSKADRRLSQGSYLPLELTWSIVPLIVGMVFFVWGAKTYFDQVIAPARAIDVYVVARQWMWKLQHSDGTREINALHVPAGYPVKLTMISEDVIHSFFVPDFRTKQDVLPGRYTTAWFEAKEPGEYHLFCAEYCGTDHSLMRGKVVVLEPADYQAWLQGGTPEPKSRGEALFRRYRCYTCHSGESKVRAPLLEGVFGRTVALADGGSAKVDEGYVRESILRPKAKVVAGYEPIMPSFEGQLSEEDIVDLIQYIQSLSAPAQTP
ncbi:MAG: cytochrome c oxidase subunit II [Pirellulales bacterium]|nr:cytochrome c oxidase subunit II [Pirellulales bacterium]